MYKRTKIVCTMGPACDSDETIRETVSYTHLTLPTILRV